MPRFLVLVLLLIAHALPADTLHVIALRHRPASEIEPVLRPLLRGEEAVSANGYQLILRASESRRREIAKLIATLDVAARQLTITVRQNAAQDRRTREDGVSGDVRVGSRGRVTIGERAPRDGVRYRGERTASSGSRASTQTLRVSDGQRAFLRMGQSVTAVERVLVLTGRGAVLSTQGITTHELTTGFDVLPRVRGDIVHLDITPRLAGPQQAEGQFTFHELQTTITARLGEWVDLGGTLATTSEIYRAILASGANQASEQVSVAIKVE